MPYAPAPDYRAPTQKKGHQLQLMDRGTQTWMRLPHIHGYRLGLDAAWDRVTATGCYKGGNGQYTGEGDLNGNASYQGGSWGRW